MYTVYAYKLSAQETTSADHSGRAAQGMSRFHPLEHWDRGFEFHLRHGYLCVFILFVFCV
jgi:hypothetical protein